ncbi:MAG: HEAT repeat domain-containing protein, partial [Eudoraea sp.]|nr:HEAT repeat domain-containing protein [Eudoraea sp.]
MSSLLSTYTMPLQWNMTIVPEELLWYMTAAFLMLAMAYLSSVFYFRTRIKNKANREAELKKDLSPMISKFLFYSEEDPLEARHEYVQLKIEMRQLLKDGLTREVLSEILRDLKKDVSGSARQELLNLYSDLGLQENAIQRLKSRRWEVLSRAILELTEMEVSGAYSLIKRHINHRSSIVRKQAQIATVSLTNEGIAYFLDSNRHPISEWQQLKLLDVIRHLEGFEAPKFKNWLTSKNADAVLFALRLIKYYKQNDAIKAIITLVNHRNQQIKIEAIQCIREFFIQEAKEALKKAFPKGNEEVKLLILDTLGLIGDNTDINYLQNIVNKSTTHTISSKASSVINTLKPETILPEADIDSQEGIDSNPTEDKPKEMEKEEKEAMSVHLPKPDFKEDPMAWEDVLNPEFEDEVIFSHCCLIEFRELIQEIGEPLLQAGDPGTLPLDFLPLIVEESTVQKTKETTDVPEETMESTSNTENSVEYPVHAEER